MKSAFEKMIEDFRKKDLQELLQTCMHADAKTAKKFPLRYRLIAVGFLAHLSLEQLEQKLTEHGCERLYARNPLEASLIFAFRRGLPMMNGAIWSCSAKSWRRNGEWALRGFRGRRSPVKS